MIILRSVILLGQIALFFCLFAEFVILFTICQNKILLRLNRPPKRKSEFTFFKRNQPKWVYFIALILVLNQVFYMFGDKTKLNGLYETDNYKVMYSALLSPDGEHSYIPAVIELSKNSDRRSISGVFFEGHAIDIDFSRMYIKSTSKDSVTADFYYNDEGWDLIISRKALGKDYVLPKLELKGDKYSFSKKSDIVHLSDCRYVKNIKSNNKLSFDDEEFICLFSLEPCITCCL